jgi:hypothetical protein
VGLKNVNTMWLSWSHAYINKFKSAISKTAPAWMGLLLGQNDLMVKCVARMERSRPQLSAYEATWDMNILVQSYNLYQIAQ